MERVVVVFDIHDIATGKVYTIAKLWNTDKEACDYVKTYIDTIRKKLTWTHCNKDDLRTTAPGAVVELYGYADKTKTILQDIVTVYHVKDEDSDNDVMKQLLREVIKKFKECDDDDISEEEMGHMWYTVAILEKILESVNQIETENKTELIISEEPNNET